MADAGKSELMQRLLGAGSEQGGSTEVNRPYGGLIVDGGMGTELKKMGVFKNLREYTTLWSAAALLHEEGRSLGLRPANRRSGQPADT